MKVKGKNTANMEREKIFGENLERIRKDRKISRKELAEKLSLTENSIGEYVNGKRSANIDKLYDLALILDVTVADLVGDNTAAKERETNEIIFKYRLQRAIDIVRVAGFNTSILSKYEPVTLIPNYKEVFEHNGDSISLAPNSPKKKKIIKFTTIEDFVEFIEMIEVFAAENRIDFRTALIERTVSK